MKAIRMRIVCGHDLRFSVLTRGVNTGPLEDKM